MTEPSTLRDQHDRQVTYIRLSVTDRCDLRCRYCLPERPDFLPKADLLTLPQLLTIARSFVDLGVTKVRVTGGEPLMRRDLPWLLDQLAQLPQLRELTLTTNGTRLANMASELRQAGVERINISLDTLSPERFARLTRNGDLRKVLAGIEAAVAAQFTRLRLNTVLMQGFNDDELTKLVQFACELGIDITFIEEMPLGDLGRSSVEHSLDGTTVLERLGRDFELQPSNHSSGGPARYWSLANSATRVGIIAPHTRNFCADCNRVRISSTGTLYPCLGHDTGTALGAAARKEDQAELERLIRAALATKPSGHQFDWQTAGGQVLRYMATTGG